MVSGDRSESAMKAYMKKMKVSFPAVKFSERKITDGLRSRRAYPWVVMVDQSGKKLYNGNAFQAIPAIEKHLK